MPKSIAIAFALGLASSSAFAGECASGSPAGSAAPEQRQASAGNGQPAAAASDGVGATGWTGGTGGNMAGLESSRKGEAAPPPQGQPAEAKGLDLKKDEKPAQKC